MQVSLIVGEGECAYSHSWRAEPSVNTLMIGEDASGAQKRAKDVHTLKVGEQS